MNDNQNDRYDVKNTISGVLVVDKPVGMTSHDVVQAIRRGSNIRRAGILEPSTRVLQGCWLFCWALLFASANMWPLLTNVTRQSFNSVPQPIPTMVTVVRLQRVR